MEAYLAFVEYGGGVIFAEQIPADECKKMILIDARDAGQLAKGHIPGAINMDWRQVLAKRRTIPKDKPVLIYGNTGSPSAQAGFAMRVAGWENLRIFAGRHGRVEGQGRVRRGGQSDGTRQALSALGVQRQPAHGVGFQSSMPGRNSIPVRLTSSW
jgi:rhodanese-related sulfurtransferase